MLTRHHADRLASIRLGRSCRRGRGRRRGRRSWRGRRCRRAPAPSAWRGAHRAAGVFGVGERLDEHCFDALVKAHAQVSQASRAEVAVAHDGGISRREVALVAAAPLKARAAVVDGWNVPAARVGVRRAQVVPQLVCDDVKIAVRIQVVHREKCGIPAAADARHARLGAPRAHRRAGDGL